MISDLVVVEAEVGENYHVLIGMDIIVRGNFSVSSYEGKTSFSFQIPATERIDFLSRKQRRANKKKLR